MTISTNLANRVKHTSLPKSAGLMPLFEAVVNSIHSIEEAGLTMSEGQIVVEIRRDAQGGLPLGQAGPGREAEGDIVGFKISDNGVGFTDENMASFKTLDSDHKAEKGCRGVGRLLWLKAFDRVAASSQFQVGGAAFERCFTFSAQAGVSGEKLVPVKGSFSRRTTIDLDGFRKAYRDASRKTVDAISRHLFEHCLWYFIRPGGAPTIIVKDDQSQISLDHVYDECVYSGVKSEAVEVKGVKFDLTHIRLRTTTSQNHQIAFCAANRLVREESLKGKIPGLYGRISDGDGDFVYSCYVASELLDESVRSERTGFDLEDEVSGLFAGTEVSLNDIRETVVQRAKAELEAYLADGIQRGKARVEKFISDQAPRYRPLLKRMPEENLVVDPAISDKELELVLHRQYSEIERDMLTQGHEILSRLDMDGVGDYKADLEKYLDALVDIKKSDLANYVSHRRVIIDLLEKAIQRDESGNYAREDLLHGLIMPLKFESNEVASEDLNLWLVDERLAFHNYLASDKTLRSMPITGDKSTKEPDLISLLVNENPILVSEGASPPFASLTVVEIKRPMRNDMAEGEDKDPIEQALGYLQRVREGGVKTAKGRPLGNASDIPGYCYVVADLTSSMVNRCKMHDFMETPDGLGYFGYKKSFKAHVEVMSFDRLVLLAKQRNRAFFERLGLPS